MMMLLLAGEVLVGLVGRPLLECSFVQDAVVVTVTVTRVLGLQKGQIVVVVASVWVKVSVMSDPVAHWVPVEDDATTEDDAGADEGDVAGSVADTRPVDDVGRSLDDDGGSEDVVGGSAEDDAGSADELDGENVRAPLWSLELAPGTGTSQVDDDGVHPCMPAP
jgi:hypothetical protein